MRPGLELAVRCERCETAFYVPMGLLLNPIMPLAPECPGCQDCPDCKGSGEVTIRRPAAIEVRPCERCKGEGWERR